MNENKNWRFCAVGNIVNEHTDEEGNVFYGTKAFVGGTKVYLYDRSFKLNDGYITVIGLNRFHRYALEAVPVQLVENVRLKQVYKPGVLSMMVGLASMDGFDWRGRTAEDKRELQKFIEEFQNYKLNY